ncbi:unnamed protein product [Malus baccata var. baccata]
MEMTEQLQTETIETTEQLQTETIETTEQLQTETIETTEQLETETIETTEQLQTTSLISEVRVRKNRFPLSGEGTEATYGRRNHKKKKRPVLRMMKLQPMYKKNPVKRIFLTDEDDVWWH